MITAIIIDDEPAAIKTLQLMLERYAPDISIIYTSSDPASVTEKIKTLQPELIFLDIQMPIMNGFDVLKQHPDPAFGIIFTTAHDQYAIEAIRFSALDYLMKPIDAEELQNAVERFKIKKEQTKNNQLLYQNFLTNISEKDNTNFTLALPTTEGTFFFSPADIIRLEGESNYTKFIFTAHKPMLLSKTLREYEEILINHSFIRIHKSHLINKKHVVRFNADGFLIMKDNSKVEISRRRKEEVMAALKGKT